MVIDYALLLTTCLQESSNEPEDWFCQKPPQLVSGGAGV
jgi:hypothetical protein